MSIDYPQHLQDQLDFIDASCQLLDKGKLRECVRIATSLRVIFHQTGNSTSLLTHLGAQDVTVLSSGKILGAYSEVMPTFADSTLVMLAPGAEIPIFAPLEKSFPPLRPVIFAEWWSEPIMVLDSKPISRRDVILSAANQDGGAHVDAALDPVYARIREGFWTLRRAGREPEKLNLTLAMTLRQMGYEVTNSPEILALTKPKLHE